MAIKVINPIQTQEVQNKPTIKVINPVIEEKPQLVTFKDKPGISSGGLGKVIVAGNTLKNTATQVGKGVLKFGESAFDTALQVGNSKYNPFNTARGEQLKANQQTAKNLIASDSTQELLDKVGYAKVNPQTGLTYQQELDAKSKLKSTGLGGQIAQTIGGQLPGIVLGNLGTGTAAKTAASILPTATSAFGGGVEQAYQSGATRGQATGYGLLNAAVESATEFITGGVPGVKSGFLSGIDKLASKGIGKVSNAVVKSLLDAGYKVVGEGFEEALAEILNPLIKNATYSKGEKVNWENVINSAVQGAIVGGLLNAPSSIADTSGAIQEQNAIKQQNKPITQATAPTNTITPTTPQISQGVAQIQPQGQTEQTSQEVKVEEPASRGYYDGQEALTLNAKIGNEVVGKIEYSDYDGTPSIEIIEVKPEFRRRGIATKLLQDLQSKYPNTEIDLGMSTEEGTKLLKTVKTKEIPSEFANDFKKLDIINKKIQEFESLPLEKVKQLTETQNDTWNDLYNEQQKLDRQLFGKKPTKQIIQQPTITPQVTTQPTIQPEVETKPTKTEEPQKVIQSSLNPNETYTLNTKKNRKAVGITKDFYRNVNNLFDKPTADRITAEFDKAKLDNVNLQNKLATDLKTNIVDKYNIQKGSKDSALIQQYGEKQITLEELKKQSPKNWQNIVEAEKFLRSQYDNLIDQINAARKEIYPNVEKTIQETNDRINIIEKSIVAKQEQLRNVTKGTIKELDLKEQLNNLQQRKKVYKDLIESDDILRNKRVEKRTDYFRHFQEEAEGFAALRNILSTSSDIAPKMVGVSDFTKPNTKFSSIAQRRKGTKTKVDAVGGFLNYIPTASFMINIDPQVYKLRKIQNDLKNQMGDDTSANKGIEFLNEFNNGLAGKQNFLDRPFQKIFDRKAMKGVFWLTNRIKSNMILGNASSSISQVLNLPQVVGKIKNPITLTQGLVDTFNKNTDYSKSQFITERYKSDIMSQFDNKLIQQPKKLATWMLGALDEVVTKTGWNALYNQAVQKGEANPIQYADNNIRDLVAGRGIGEKTVIQESKVANLLMPFTVEVGNLNRVMGDFAKSKDIVGLLLMFLAANLLNKAVKGLGAGGRTFDPIEAIKEAVTEEDITLLQRFGRFGGEIISNIPLGQQIAKLYPEYGTKTLPTRRELFGSNDPTRFGTGGIFSKAIESPITAVITPWGGSQLDKIKKGYDIIKKGGEYKDGKLKYPVDKNTLNTIRAFTFGSTKETQEFYDKGRRILSADQTKQVEASPNIKAAYENMMQVRTYNRLLAEFKELKKQGKDTTKKEQEIQNLLSGKE